MKYAMTVPLFAVCASALAPPSSASAQCAYTVGGTVYRDCDDPITTGEQDVEVCVDCDGGFNACTTTSGGWGGWMIEDVPCGTCTVTLEKAELVFCRVTGECPPDPCVHPIGITVGAEHQAENMTLGFWADEVTCPNGTCDPGEDACSCPEDCGGMETSCTDGQDNDCDGCTDGADSDCGGTETNCTDGQDNDCDFLIDGCDPDCEPCDGDPDGDGVIGCDDVCPCTPSPGGVNTSGRPLGDLDNDCDVDLEDHSIMGLNFTGPRIP